MDSRIELMDRRRRTLLTWLFWGLGGWFGLLLIYWTISIPGIVSPGVSLGIIGSINKYLLYGSLGIAAVFLFFLGRWWLYKRSLRKDSALQAAVNDELVERSWLRAFRFSFFCLIALVVLNVLDVVAKIFIARSLSPQDFGRVSLYLYVLSSPFLYLFVAVMSCIGAFLRFSRERS